MCQFRSFGLEDESEVCKAGISQKSFNKMSCNWTKKNGIHPRGFQEVDTEKVLDLFLDLCSFTCLWEPSEEFELNGQRKQGGSRSQKVWGAGDSGHLPSSVGKFLSMVKC